MGSVIHPALGSIRRWVGWIDRENPYLALIG
jgi:hypothetical protein